MRVLVVEDNPLLRHHLAVQLREMGHQVDAAEDAKEADYFLNEHTPDITLVDLGLPDEDGMALIRRWRSQEVRQPILVLTAREGWQDKVEVLSAGADDYVTKPFHIEEVAARMQALMRRNSGLASQIISLPPFQVQGAIMVASCFQILVGFSGIIGFLMRFIGPLTIAPTITLVALPLFDSAGDKAGQHWGIAFM